MHIYVHTADQRHTLEVDPTDRIGMVKAKLEEKTGRTLTNHHLLFQEVVMEDDNTLHACGIKKKDVLFISQTINILVYTGNKTLSLSVETASLVSRVMEQIQENDGIATETQHLIFAGKPLKEDIRLYMYDVQQGSTLHLGCRVVGGAVHCLQHPQEWYMQRQ